MKSKSWGISGTALKWIGVCSMTLSHIGLALKPLLGEGPAWWLNQAGRPAFVIFAFLLTEGFIYTSSRKRYLGRLLLLAAVSEIPYDLALWGRWADPERQNVFWTLAAGLGALWLAEGLTGLILRRGGRGTEGDWLLLWTLTLAGTAFPGGIFCRALGTDYGRMGILLIAWFYWARDSRLLQLAGAFAIFLMFVGSDVLAGTCLALIFLSLYDGTRGKHPCPAFFYWYYPVHLAVLALAGRFLFYVYISTPK